MSECIFESQSNYWRCKTCGHFTDNFDSSYCPKEAAERAALQAKQAEFKREADEALLPYRIDRLRVYTASKTFRAANWLELARQWKEIDFVARWLQVEGSGISEAPCFARVFWQHDIEDVKKADAMLLLVAPEDQLAGTIIEAGAAIGLGKPVLLVGQHELFSTWQWHPLVFRVEDLEQARKLLGLMKVDLLGKRSEA